MMGKRGSEEVKKAGSPESELPTFSPSELPSELPTFSPSELPSSQDDFIEEDYMTGRPHGFADTLGGLLQACDVVGVRGIIIGAGALAAYGAPRYTRDIVQAPGEEASLMEKHPTMTITATCKKCGKRVKSPYLGNLRIQIIRHEKACKGK